MYQILNLTHKNCEVCPVVFCITEDWSRIRCLKSDHTLFIPVCFKELIQLQQFVANYSLNFRSE
ncbi:hypothetical protein AQPE_4801 [Aquipluma nitroreducens]|uniref:Uncharacterized protein n=1 Tax=Aquipluma nitroreducens TaxID=2010828 RepID=A0A5K7SGQ0_9BACT|nr:hypothetical protein AQPE_4801 [Aquipluma nitroreducens]